MSSKFKEELLQESMLESLEQVIHALMRVRSLGFNLLLLKGLVNNLIGDAFTDQFFYVGVALAFGRLENDHE